MINFLLAVSTLAFSTPLIRSRIVGGELAPSSLSAQTVAIAPLFQPDPIHCSATFVGKRVLLFANHCLTEQDEGHLFFRQQTHYFQVVRSPFLMHDLAIGITEYPIDSANPISVGGNTAVGTAVQILGYGCHDLAILPDGKLRMTKGRVFGYLGPELLHTTNEVPACGGDSGGAVVSTIEKKRELIAVISGIAGIAMYATRLDSEHSKTFLRQVIADYQVEVCGVNVACP